MSDVRLIDANALYDTITDVASSVGHDVMAVEDVHHCIDKAPTIDAVEVVRCRECKYAEKTVWSSGEMYCRVWKMNPRPDGFCHLGAKMDAKDMDVPTKDGGAE